MVHEKTFNLAVGREAKIIVKGASPKNGREVVIEFEFLIKDSHDAYFHPPIGVNHPQYWKLRKSTPEKSQLLQLEYSGISRKQLNASIREFKQLSGPGLIFSYKIRMEDRIKSLKGIRVDAIDRRLLASA